MNRKELVERQEALQREIQAVKQQLSQLDDKLFIEDYCEQYEGRYFKHYSSYNLNDDQRWPVYFRVDKLLNQHSFIGCSIDFKPDAEGFTIRLKSDSKFDISILREEVPQREFVRAAELYAKRIRDIALAATGPEDSD